MTKKWFRERKNEYYYRLAKIEGYRSRASYKLLQAVEKYPFIKKGDVVVDLGAAPGGWMQVARKLVEEEGYILGVDIQPIANMGFKNVYSIIGDVEKIEKSDILKNIPKEADVILSDISPNVSGFWEIDHAKQINLTEHSLRIALNTLRAGGSFFVKTFQGKYLKEFIDQVKAHFKDVRIFKPKASRKASAELYIVALDKI